MKRRSTHICLYVGSSRSHAIQHTILNKLDVSRKEIRIKKIAIIFVNCSNFAKLFGKVYVLSTCHEKQLTILSNRRIMH